MNLLTGAESDELFGGEVSPSVRHLIDVARNAPPDQVEAALWTAALSGPDQLPIYYLLYKMYFGRGQLDRAAQAARKGLEVAARVAALAPNWQAVQLQDANFQHPGAARYWLFTLKALAFIHLRLGDRVQAQAMLAQLHRLDPGDQLGLSVLDALLLHTG